MEGGSAPAWREDGREIYYFAPNGRLMAVPFQPGPPMQIGEPKALFVSGASIDELGGYLESTLDGQRFLFVRPVGTRTRPAVVLDQGWSPAQH
jgi:hypothetical protein